MPTRLEQPQAADGHEGSPGVAEQDRAEIPEYDEAGLRELINEAAGRVENDASNVLKTSDARIERADASTNLDPQKAASVWNQGGFQERIQLIKEEVAALAGYTKAKINALVAGGNKKEEAQETPHPTNLAEYIEARKHDRMTMAEDAVRLARLKRANVESPERVLGVLNYLGENIADKEYHSVTIDTAKKNREIEKWKGRGFTVSEHPSNLGTSDAAGSSINLLAIKEMPHHFNIKDAAMVEDLFGREGDPVATFESLRKMSVPLDWNDLQIDTDGLKKLFADPDVPPLLKKLEAASDVIGGRGVNLFGSYNGQEESLRRLAKLDADKNVLDESNVKNLGTLSSLLEYPIGYDSAEQWTTVAADEGAMDLLRSLKETTPGSKYYKHDEEHLAKNLYELSSSGDARFLANLLHEGLDPKSLRLNDLKYSSFKLSEIPVINELRENPQLHEFMVTTCRAFGVPLALEQSEFQRVKEYFEHPGASEAFHVLKNLGLLNEDAWRSSPAMEDILKTETIETLLDPGFQDFFARMKTLGWTSSLGGCLWPEGESLISAYRDQSLRAALDTEEGFAIAEKLNVFKNNFSEQYLFRALLSCPNPRQTLEILSRDFDYRYDADSAGAQTQLREIIELAQDENLSTALSSPDVVLAQRSLQENFGFKFRPSEAGNLVELVKDPVRLERLSDPATIVFMKKMSPTFNINTVKALANCDPSLYQTLERLRDDFSYRVDANYDGLAWQEEIEQLRDNPTILDAAKKLEAVGVTRSPLANFEEIKIILERNIIEALTQCQGFPEIQRFVIDRVADITVIPDGTPAMYLKQIFENPKGSIREQQMVCGELMGSLLFRGKYGDIEKIAANDTPEQSAELRESYETIKQFAEKYNVSGKGQTIATLLAMREYSGEKGLSATIEKVGESIRRYERFLEDHTPRNIPEGLRASIGMEYEITESTAKAYREESGSGLRADMCEVSRFAGVGRGADAVFEIATKPTDNPHLMLLEMKLLQELGFIDLNFEKPGYDHGARGYHMTVGGEEGIEVGADSNFLQNALVVSGWGGINAGREVSRLSKGRGVNIRQRDSYHTTPVFKNTSPAVEFRSLSLDAWEPFERAVETSYYGAVAMQAFEKYVAPLAPGELAELRADTPEQLVGALKEKGFLRSDIGDDRTKQIIFQWARLQAGTLMDIDDHNENFMQNEMYGYSDEKGRWIDAAEFGGDSNRSRFLGVAGGEEGLDSYQEKIRIDPSEMFFQTTPDLANRCAAVTNLFIKPSSEAGGDAVNAASSLDTTKVGRTVEEADIKAKYLSEFDVNGKTREGYYYLQGGSERMLIHKTQKRLLEFKKTMERIVA